MSNETEAIDTALSQQLADRLRALRARVGWSLETLAQASGVSRSMISQIERGASSPTAVVLARLAAAFGLPLASLFDTPTETPDPVARAAAQPVWRDPGTGYRRRNVSPADPALTARLVEVELPPGAQVLYENTPAGPGAVQQQVWLLAGRLALRWGDARWSLEPGDCAAMTLDRPTGFHNPGTVPARYAVVLAGGVAR